MAIDVLSWEPKDSHQVCPTRKPAQTDLDDFRADSTFPIYTFSGARSDESLGRTVSMVREPAVKADDGNVPAHKCRLCNNP